MSNLKQLKCPSCGAVLELDIPNQLTTICPYCHQQVVYTVDEIEEFCFCPENSVSGDERNQKKFGIPFSESDDKFRDRVIQKIANDNGTPLDIFTKAKIVDAQKVYVPLYEFTGNFQSSWTSMVIHYKPAQRVNYKGELENYEERDPKYFSGNSSGHFNSIVCAINSGDINKHIYSYFEDNNLVSLSSGAVPLEDDNDGIRYLPIDYTPDSAWTAVGESRATYNAHVRSNFPGSTQSFSATFSDKKHSLFYIPCRIIEFDYDGNIYKCVEVLSKLYCDYPIIEGYSGDTEESDSDDDSGCGAAIVVIIVAVLLTWFFWWLYELIGLKGDVLDHLGCISTWLLFFFVMVYGSIKGNQQMKTKKQDELGGDSIKFKKEEKFELFDFFIMVFFAIGISYIGFHVGRYIGGNVGPYIWVTFFISCYCLYKYRKSEINKKNEEIKEHNNKIRNMYISYREEKLKSSSSFIWTWRVNNNMNNQANKVTENIYNTNKENSKQSNIKYCRHCGKELKTGYKFCGFCGEKQG